MLTPMLRGQARSLASVDLEWLHVCRESEREVARMKSPDNLTGRFIPNVKTGLQGQRQIVNPELLQLLRFAVMHINA